MAFGKVDSVDNSSPPPSLRILVVDDDDLNRRMMEILLGRDGHQVELVTNGQEALDAVKRNKYDVVFMDLQMPTMDGIEASRRIREWERDGLRTYIVALTASYLPEEGQTLFEAGIDNYISKPFDVEHIDHLLNYIARTVHVTAGRTAVAPDASASSNLLDVQKGIQRVGGDPDAYRELLTDFVQDLSKRVEALEQHMLEKNWSALSRGAHNMKGIAASLGALELAEQAGKLDKGDKEGYTDADHSLIKELKRVETLFRQAATDFLAKKEITVTQA